LPRVQHAVEVLGHIIGVKVVTLPDGSTRAKPEFDDVRRAAAALGMPLREVAEAVAEASRK
jgi:uncharacterized protein (DUF111 family)